jgi:hypothetical protein
VVTATTPPLLCVCLCVSVCVSVCQLCLGQMLSRVYTLLHANNPDLVGRTRKVLKPPEICRVGSTRIAWVNFKEICAMYVGPPVGAGALCLAPAKARARPLCLLVPTVLHHCSRCLRLLPL